MDDENGYSSRPNNTGLGEGFTKNVEAIEKEIEDTAEDEFVVKDEYEDEDDPLAAENEEFIADNEELIIEDEIIAEEDVFGIDEELTSKADHSNKLIWTSSPKTRFLSNNEQESNPCQNNKNCLIDLQRGIISLENNNCSNVEQNESCCLLYDYEGNEKIVPILYLENFEEPKRYSDFDENFHSKFDDYEKHKRKEFMEAQIRDQLDISLLVPEVKVDIQDSASFTHKDESEKEHIIQYQCDQCTKSYVKRANLWRHMKCHNLNNQNNCPHCGYITTDKSAFKAHIRRHLGVKPFYCTQCDYRTDNSCNLERHVRIHNGDKPLFCRDCNFRCADASALKVHIKRHQGVKPHKCPFCNYRSLDKVSMVRHLMIHTGEKPYHCFFCKFKCIRFDKLLSHFKRYDGSAMVCGFCPFNSNNAEEFIHHLKLNHREDWEIPSISNELYNTKVLTNIDELDCETVTIPKNT